MNDVAIGNWKRPWNLKNEARLPGVPMAALWASDPAGFGQVGCIYTAQGCEYDYGGIIFGPDLVRRAGTWVADSSQSKDSIVRRAENFDELVRHVYRALLTRGLRGCELYSTERETQEFVGAMTDPFKRVR